MNFTNTVGEKDFAVELKYCERCGSLWFRRPGQIAVHCAGCRARLVALLRGRRHPERYVGKNQIRIECLLGVTEMEVRQ